MQFKNLSFRADYEVKILSGEQGAAVTHDFIYTPSLQQEPGGLVLNVATVPEEAVIIEVTTSTEEVWVGRFEPGLGGTYGLFATPSPETLCVVVKGQGYWVPVLAPRKYETIPSTPIKEVFAVSEAQVMIFQDFVRLTAYGDRGLLWQSSDLSWDGLKVTEITAQKIVGFGWDAPKEEEVEFSVVVKDGTSKGGSSPKMYKQQL